jgi:hypothetical protein
VEGGGKKEGREQTHLLVEIHNDESNKYIIFPLAVRKN